MKTSPLVPSAQSGPTEGLVGMLTGINLFSEPHTSPRLYPEGSRPRASNKLGLSVTDSLSVRFSERSRDP